MARLLIIIASTRPGRVGLPIGLWFAERARTHGAFEIEIGDLAELGLPFMDEPNHPRLRQYVHQHTKDWSEQVDAADAFVFVTPEYNHGLSAPLKNAIDFLHMEWQHKPVGFVSYGGLAAGTRAVQMLKQIVAAVKLTPSVPAVHIPFVHQFVDEEQQVQATETMETSAKAMLDELQLLERTLRPLRAS